MKESQCINLFAAERTYPNSMVERSSTDFSAALELGLAALAKRDQPEHKIRAQLIKAGFESETIDSVIERLQSKRILNDERFAHAHVRARVAKGIGVERIRLELQQLGVDTEVILLATSAPAQDASELAFEALQRRVQKSPPLNRARAMRFLSGRGFSDDEVEHAVSLVFGAVDEFTE